MVVRPPILYGKSASFVAYFILDAALEATKKSEKFITPVESNTRWQTIHQDDVGEAFRAIAEVVGYLIPHRRKDETDDPRVICSRVRR